MAFGDRLRVFVSTDKTSIGAGKKWYSYIIDNLRASEVVLVLLSQESRRREWTNFEAGFGEGSDCLVIPITVNNFPFAQLSYPLAGIQGRSIDEIGTILDDIANKIGATPAAVDSDLYLQEVRGAEADLVYKSLIVQPSWTGQAVGFTIENAGNIDLELLMLEVLIPSDVIGKNWHPNHVHGIDHRSAIVLEGGNYRWFGCYSPRGAYRSVSPLLMPFVTPSMGKVSVRMFTVPLELPFTAVQLDAPIFFHLHAIGYTTERTRTLIRDIPGITKP